MKLLPPMPEMRFNPIHLKRALYYIGAEFSELEFDTKENVSRVVNGTKVEGGFEFAPEDYDYSNHNPIIDQAFAVWLAAPYGGNALTFKASYKDGTVNVCVTDSVEGILFTGKTELT